MISFFSIALVALVLILAITLFDQFCASGGATHNPNDPRRIAPSMKEAAEVSEITNSTLISAQE